MKKILKKIKEFFFGEKYEWNKDKFCKDWQIDFDGFKLEFK